MVVVVVDVVVAVLVCFGDRSLYIGSARQARGSVGRSMSARPQRGSSRPLSQLGFRSGSLGFG